MTRAAADLMAQLKALTQEVEAETGLLGRGGSFDAAVAWQAGDSREAALKTFATSESRLSLPERLRRDLRRRPQTGDRPERQQPPGSRRQPQASTAPSAAPSRLPARTRRRRTTAAGKLAVRGYCHRHRLRRRAGVAAAPGRPPPYTNISSEATSSSAIAMKAQPSAWQAADGDERGPYRHRWRPTRRRSNDSPTQAESPPSWGVMAPSASSSPSLTH
jgi:hypothetical protein